MAIFSSYVKLPDGDVSIDKTAELPTSCRWHKKTQHKIVPFGRGAENYQRCRLGEKELVIFILFLPQWVDLRENLQETIDFPMKYGSFLYFFPLTINHPHKPFAGFETQHVYIIHIYIYIYILFSSEIQNKTTSRSPSFLRLAMEKVTPNHHQSNGTYLW